MNFEWDENKAISNLKKHKIAFEEAKTIFRDPFSITIDDPDHSDSEIRYIDIGQSSKGRIFIVCYTEHIENIRIISCRKASASERKVYENK
jgi:uncharacterized protein